MKIAPFNFKKTAITGVGYYNPPTSANPQNEFNFVQDTSKGIIQDGENVNRLQMLRHSEGFDPDLAPYHQSDKYRKFYPGNWDYKKSRENEETFPHSSVKPLMTFYGNTEKSMKNNVYTDGFPRNGVVADLNLEKMRNDQFSGAIGALLNDFKNLPANIAAALPAPVAMPAPAFGAPVAPGAVPVPGRIPALVPAAAPVPGRIPALVPAAAPGVPPPPPPPPPAPAPGKKSSTPKAAFADSEDQKMFQAIILDNVADLPAFESYYQRIFNEFKDKIGQLEAKGLSVNPAAQKFLNSIDKFNFTELNQFVVDGGSDMNKLPNETRNALIALLRYESAKQKNSGKNPITIEGPKKPDPKAAAASSMMDELAKKISARRSVVAGSVSPRKKSDPSVESKEPPASTEMEIVMNFYDKLPSIVEDYGISTNRKLLDDAYKYFTNSKLWEESKSSTTEFQKLFDKFNRTFQKPRTATSGVGIQYEKIQYLNEYINKKGKIPKKETIELVNKWDSDQLKTAFEIL